MSQGDAIQVQLKSIRAKAGLSLDRTAELTGVSKAMLGQIERGESSPTIATLWKIAKGLHLPLTALLAAPAPLPDRPAAVFPESLTFDILFDYDPTLGTETFLITLKPMQTHCSEAHDIGVVEDIMPITGDMEVLQGGAWVPCLMNNGLRLKADQPHGYRNPSNEPIRFLNTVHYPHVGITHPDNTA